MSKQTKTENNLVQRLKRGVLLPPETDSVMASYKDPLTPVKDGFGYYGTIAYDTSQKYSQCHLCGYFFKTLGKHVSSVHNKDPKQYRLEFGLPTSLSLTAPKMKNKNYEQWQGYSDDQKAEAIKKMREGRDNRTMPERWRKKSLYAKNIEGRCPEQLLDKILNLQKKLGYTPSRRDFIKEYGTGHVTSVNLTFGGWGEAIKILNLQPKPKGNPAQPNYDKETLLTLLFEFRKRYNREPMSDDTEKGLLPHRQTYRNHFGSWSKAKEYVA